MHRAVHTCLARTASEWICQNSGLWRRQDPDLGLTSPALRFGASWFLAHQHGTTGLEP